MSWIPAALSLGALAAAAPAAAQAPQATGLQPVTTDAIDLRDRSHLVGKIAGMKDGTLTLELAGGGEEAVKWHHVAGISSPRRHVLVLKDGSRLAGSFRAGPTPGAILLRREDGQELAVPLRQVVEINPPADAWHLKGSLSLSAAASDGNTSNRSLGLLGELDARNASHRLSADARYHYADDDEGVTARNGLARGQYDYFVLPRIYTLANVLFENDRFQDLDLRSVLGAGLGYQVAERGDYPDEYLNGHRWLNDLDVRAEAGLAYFIEDYHTASNNAYLAARWSARLDWRPFPRVTVFHRHDGFPSVEDAEDVYVLTQQGVRVDLYGGFFAGFQVNWDWDNTPAAGFDRSEALYMINVGVLFEN